MKSVLTEHSGYDGFGLEKRNKQEKPENPISFAIVHSFIGILSFSVIGSFDSVEFNYFLVFVN